MSDDLNKTLDKNHREFLGRLDAADREVEEHRARFEHLHLVLQRAVKDVVDEAEYTNRSYRVPSEEFEIMVGALEAIHDYAHLIAYGEERERRRRR